jgi:hypothetical protein
MARTGVCKPFAKVVEETQEAAALQDKIGSY